jgi:type I restriction enzyme M protein
MRADFAILDVPVTSINSNDVDELLDHAILLCEVKRDNAEHEYVKTTQVRPLLDFAKLEKCIALYWDNVDQRIFWTENLKGKKETKEANLTLLPKYGAAVKLKPITFEQTTPTSNLIELFDRIEVLLHIAAIDPEQRYSIILQLLLAKLFDEHGHQSSNQTLNIQDFAALGHTGTSALASFNATLSKAVSHYAKHLPKDVESKLPQKVTGEILLEICKLFAHIRIIASKREVIQVFYMKFAKGLYKWDMAQFFTPPTVTDFIVDVLNPQFGEHIKDPACGSADFLTAAFHKRRAIDDNYADSIWGTDNSKNAVQVAVLNMLLNGDGKSNIKEADSLANAHADANSYEIMVCNPPFGVKIVEKNPKVLRRFELGYEWSDLPNVGYEKKEDVLLKAQETGLLFVEVCVIQAKPGGRIGIILPNGYLGNRSRKYRIFRDWLLRHCKVAAVASFPRFTFKTSGADVSTSVVYLEKRQEPLQSVHDDSGYNLNVEMIENVGWNLGDKKAAPRYQRDPIDGSFIVANGEKLLDSDFAKVLDDLRHSPAIGDFPWLTVGVEAAGPETGWSISIKDILEDADLTLDPKRHCRKFRQLQLEISKKSHFRLADLVTFIPEGFSSSGKRSSKSIKKSYQYVEIQDIGYGDFTSTDLKGWELPSRAKHFAEPADIYIGAIWGSVSKWCIMPQICEGIVVTNGCHRVRVKPEMKTYTTDLVAFLCSEAYAIQMRALSRGSDGLAEITVNDAEKVLVSKLSNAERELLNPHVERLLAGTPDICSQVVTSIVGGATLPAPKKRPSHVVLV